VKEKTDFGSILACTREHLRKLKNSRIQYMQNLENTGPLTVIIPNTVCGILLEKT